MWIVRRIYSYHSHCGEADGSMNAKRISELCAGQDRTRELKPAELAAAGHLRFTSDIQDLSATNVYIVTVPTLIDASNCPDLAPLIHASEAIVSLLKAGDIVIYEPRVFPGATLGSSRAGPRACFRSDI